MRELFQLEKMFILNSHYNLIRYLNEAPKPALSAHLHQSIFPYFFFFFSPTKRFFFLLFRIFFPFFVSDYIIHNIIFLVGRERTFQQQRVFLRSALWFQGFNLKAFHYISIHGRKKCSITY